MQAAVAIAADEQVKVQAHELRLREQQARLSVTAENARVRVPSVLLSYVSSVVISCQQCIAKPALFVDRHLIAPVLASRGKASARSSSQGSGAPAGANPRPGQRSLERAR